MPLQNLPVADEHRLANRLHRGIERRLEGDFRADAARVTGREGYFLFN
jgi:hypothetical protein